MKNIFLFLSLLISTVGFSQEVGIIFQQDAWGKVIQKAKAENKLIFMDAYTTWCGPCKAMQAKVFPDKKLGSFFNDNFINVKVDMEAGEGLALGIKYPVKGYPSLFFIDPKSGKIVNQALGYKTPEQLLQIGEQTQGKKKGTI